MPLLPLASSIEQGDTDMTRSICWGFMICCAMLAVPLQAAEVKAAEEAYFRCVLRELPLSAGKLPEDDGISDNPWSSNRWNGCRVVLDGSGEAYVDMDTTIRHSILYARVKPGQALKGRIICLPERSDTPASVVSFELPAERASVVNNFGFYRAKEAFYANLWQRELTGSAWFRHQRDVTRTESRLAGRIPPALQENFRRGPFRSESDQMFDMMSGGRAISENLQLRRAMLSTASTDNQLVALDTVHGITTKEVDWSKLIQGLEPQIDTLAALIPADQHAVFFPSFTELLRIADEAEAGVTPILHAIEPRAEDAGTIDRYQTQLCLSRSGLSRVLGPKYIRSVALTGSDVNYRTGTDVAVLFEAVNTADLRTLLETKIKLTLFGRAGVEAVQGDIHGVAYQGHRTADRTISTYLAIIDKAVVVTNSLEQLRRLVETQANRKSSLAALPEMKYFRERYKLGAADEHAFVILSDATIRRWCGPRWRIGSARQLRELATMMELTSQRLDELVQRKPAAKPLDPEVFQTKVDDYRLTPDGIESPSIGSLRFLTPIAELPLTTATRKEMADYSQWRDGYQQNWTRGFDPIAIRLTLLPERIATDVTVLPLIDNTVYRYLINPAKAVKLQANSGDPHDTALFQFILALDQDQSSMLTHYLVLFGFMNGEDLGTSLAIYLDDAPELWKELAKLTPEELKQHIDQHASEMPWALRIGITDAAKIAKENIAEVGKFERSLSGRKFDAKRQLHKHRDVDYVALRTVDGDFPKLYLAVTSDAFMIALHEKTIQAAIDRDLDREKNKPEKAPIGLGQHATLHLDPKAMEVFDMMSRSPRQREMQNLAWSNLPILNEWRRLYPDQDPVELHARLWKTRLVCPGGGKYVWSDQWRTMESTLYGHPAQPKAGPLPSLASLGVRAADFGLTFVDGGLRARVEVQRQPPKP